MRAVVGPFSLDLDNDVDRRIAELFDSVVGRRKTETFRNIMSEWFALQDEDLAESEQIEKIKSMLAELLARVESGSLVTEPITDESYDRLPLDAADIEKAEEALSALGGL